mgnify:FL=1|jgi:hypothetical protein
MPVLFTLIMIQFIDLTGETSKIFAMAANVTSHRRLDRTYVDDNGDTVTEVEKILSAKEEAAKQAIYP